MLKAFVTAYPWDLADHLDRTLDHLQGEVGITGLHLWAGVPPVNELRTGDVRPRILRDTGGLTFQPEGGTLRGTSWRPIISDWARTREAVANITAACDARGLDLRFALSIGSGGRIPLHHPETACVNALAAPSQYSACICDREVEAYSRAILDELARRFGKRTIVLHDLFPAWSDHAHGSWEMPAKCGELEKSALSICFCESCCQTSAAAGVDVTTARKQAGAIIDGAGRSGEVHGFAHLLADAPALSAHLAAQWAALAEILTRWTASRHAFVVHHDASPLSLAATAPDSFRELPSAILSQIENPDFSKMHVANHHELLLGPGLARSLDESQLVSLLQDAARCKYQAIHAGNCGTQTPAQWDALRKAIRFARRTSES